MTRRANDRAQFHQRLIEVRTVPLARSLSPWRGPDQVLRELPEPGVGLPLARIFGDTEEAGEHANDIAVEHRRGLVERYAADRAGGVTADAGQGDQCVEPFRKPLPPQEPEPLPYLRANNDFTLDIELEADLQTSLMHAPQVITRPRRTASIGGYRSRITAASQCARRRILRAGC